MNKFVSALFKYGIPVAISVGLAWFLYANVDVAAIENSLRQDVDYRWFLAVLVVSTLSHVLRALRWRMQLVAIGVRAPLSILVDSIFGTYFVNLLFPRLGEVWRCGYVARRERAPFAQVLGSMVADRLSDTVTVLLLTLLTFVLAADKLLLFLGQRDDGSGNGALWLIVGLGLAVALVVAALVRMARSDSANPVVVKIRNVLLQLWDGLASIWRMDGKWNFVLLTVGIWGCYYLQLYLAAQAFTFARDLGALPILVLFVLSSIGMAVPSNGGLGPWQFAIIFGFTLYGIGAFPPHTPYDAQASAFAWLVWGVQTLLLIVLGIYAFTHIAIDNHRQKHNIPSSNDDSSTDDER